MIDDRYNMSSGKRNNERYRTPNDVETFILDIFLNKIYLDQNYWNREYAPGLFRLPLNDPRFRMPREWSNTPQELYNQYVREYGEEKGYDKPSMDKVYRALKKYVAAGILKETPNTDKLNTESKYYPIETKEGYINLLRFVREDYVHGYYPGNKFHLNPVYSEFSNRVLNRQFVLDVLRENLDSIRIDYRGRLYDIPLVGRFRKNYELLPEVEVWIEVLTELEEMIGDEQNKDYRSVKELLLGIDEEMPDKDYYKITPEKRESNLQLLAKLRTGLESERDYIKLYAEYNAGRINNLDTISQFSDKTADEYVKHFKEMSPDYPGLWDNAPLRLGLNWYKDEAVWNGITLNEQDKSRLNGLPQELIDYYEEWINDMIVMPILCLIQMSPSALYLFTSTGLWKPKERVMTFSSSNKRILPTELWRYQIDKDQYKEVAEFLANGKSLNALLGHITKSALVDYCCNKVCIKKDWNLHGQLNRTQLIAFGASDVKFSEDDEIHVPSLFTFSVYKDYSVSIFFSECPLYNPTTEFISPVADHPRAGVYDWSPAVGYTYRKVYFPSARLYELMTMILQSVGERDFCLSNLLKEALLTGTIGPE